MRKLESLQKLEELYIPNMDHQVQEVPEVEWMMEHLPKLSRLEPLVRLVENHPEIQPQGRRTFSW